MPDERSGKNGTPPLVVWVKNPEDYVSSCEYNWRIQHAERFGESLRGFSDGSGVLHTLCWNRLVGLHPSSLEVNNQKNPLSEFLHALDFVGPSISTEFFKKLKVLNLNMCDIKVENLIRLLTRLHLLEGFAYQDVTFNKDDWNSVAPELSRLSLRALDISSNEIDTLLSKLDVEMVKFSGNPGVDVKVLKASESEFVTVKTLIAQELNFTSDRDAEQFLAILPSKFPRLSFLFFDWNLVDPCVINDDRTKNIVLRLIEISRSLELGLLAVLAYTPDWETKQAFGEIARQLSEANLASVDIRLFCSRGVEAETPNFSIILAGNNAEQRQRLLQIVVDNRCSIPQLRQLLSLLSDGGSVPDRLPSLIDFGGLDGEQIRKTYESRPVERELNLS